MADVYEHARRALARGMAVVIKELESELGDTLKVTADFTVMAPVMSYEHNPAGWREWTGNLKFAWKDGDKEVKSTHISDAIGKAIPGSRQGRISSRTEKLKAKAGS